MSGQPVNTKAQANQKRNEYMETLALQESINDMNLQANKTYLLTGQLPPASQMQDTRTTAEKLADVEKLKHRVADELRPIAEPSVAYAIIQQIITNPLNADGGLFRFLAQKAASIVMELKKVLTYGIVGDANDISTIVNFIKNMYSKQNSLFQSTKTYFNSLSSGGYRSNIIDSNDIDKVIAQLQDVIRSIKTNKYEIMGPDYDLKIDNLAKKLVDFKSSILTTSQLQALLRDLEDAIGREAQDDITERENLLSNMFDLLEKTPVYSNIATLLGKLDRYIRAGDRTAAEKIVDALISEFSFFFDPSFGRMLQAIRPIKERYERDEARQRVQQVPVQQIPVQAQPRVQQPIQAQPIQAPPRDFANVQPLAIEARRARIRQVVRRLTAQQQAQVILLRNDPAVRNVDELIDNLANDPTYDLGDFNIGGLGLIKHKRVGRPRGSGMPKPEPIKIPTFVGFGINEINQKQLDKGILKIRRNTRTSYDDMPSKHISKGLQSIFKTILGGGMPKYEELGKLDDEEKEYLYKVVSRSNLADKLSVPAPSKDQQEKDIHNFEVMRGQIMSGNDNKDLVRKFKLLMRKLSRQGLLPRAEVDDMIETLTDLGY